MNHSCIVIVPYVVMSEEYFIVFISTMYFFDDRLIDNNLGVVCFCECICTGLLQWNKASDRWQSFNTLTPDMGVETCHASLATNLLASRASGIGPCGTASVTNTRQ